jgi:hypothetical protein
MSETSGPPENHKKIVKKVVSAESTALWRPNSLAEWAHHETLRTVLPVWAEQARSDRAQRERIAFLTFGLLFFEVAASLGILVGRGRHILDVADDLLKIVFVSMFAQVVGLSVIIVRNLFGERKGIAEIMAEIRTAADSSSRHNLE